MTSTLERPVPKGPPRPDPSLGRAWLSVLVVPFFFFIVFALGYVVYDAFGYAPEDNDAPLGVDLVVSVLGLAVFALPCVAAVVFGRRAHRAGDRRGLLPAGLGALAGVAFTALTVVTLVADALG